MTEPAKLICAFALGFVFALVFMREVNAPPSRARAKPRYQTDDKGNLRLVS